MKEKAAPRPGWASALMRPSWRFMVLRMELQTQVKDFGRAAAALAFRLRESKLTAIFERRG